LVIPDSNEDERMKADSPNLPDEMLIKNRNVITVHEIRPPKLIQRLHLVSVVPLAAGDWYDGPANQRRSPIRRIR
jgi:hypothetical protein